jgi:hypothetical protein
VRPELLHRAEDGEDRFEMDAQKIGPREARIEALAGGYVPNHLLVVGEVPRRAGQAVQALKLLMKRPGEAQDGGQHG